MPQKILLIFAHPLLEKSQAHAAMLRHLPGQEDITFHDLYERYPDFNIDVATEKALLQSHDLIVWQHPLYWYSCPPLLKQWIDMVLEFGWAYGPQGQALAGKPLLQIISAGGQREAYQPEGRNRFHLRTLLSPFEQTAYLCKMPYLPPLVLHGTHRLKPEEMELHAQKYAWVLKRLVEAPLPEELPSRYEYLNDWIETLYAYE